MKPPGRVSQVDAPQMRAMLRLVMMREGVKPDVDYQTRPIEWARDRLGIPTWAWRWSELPEYEDHDWDGDRDPLAVMWQALVDGHDTAAESATGTGKTFWGAVAVLWFISCHEDALVITTAPRQKQLQVNLWKEIGRLWKSWHRHYPEAQLLDLELRRRGAVDEKGSWTAYGMGCGVGAGEVVANRMRGFHAAHMLFVLEELTGIPEAVTEAIEQTCVGEHNLQAGLGNPDSQQDALHRFCKRDGTVEVRISAYDHPNVVTGDSGRILGAVTQKSIDRRLKDLGPDHRLFRSRVRGISPAEAVDSLIKRRLCEEAVARYSDPLLRIGEPALGVDVANSEAGDPASIARGLGRCLLEVESRKCPNALQLGRDLGAEIRASDILPSYVGVDSIGVGSNVINGLAEEGLRVRDLNGSFRAQTTIDWELREDQGITVVDAASLFNLRAQMWWQMRRDLERGLIALPDDPELIDDLVEPKWWTQNGKIILEPKEEIKERLKRSPDKGDAAVYWNWVRPRRERESEGAVDRSRSTLQDTEVVERPEHYDTGFEELMEVLRARKKAGRAF